MVLQVQNKEDQFSTPTIEFGDDRIFTVIVGANNSGKSTFIRSLAKSFREWRMLLKGDHVCVLTKNGIEHYYPERILQEVFATGSDRNTIIKGYLESDPNSYNGVLLSKTQLAKVVSEKLIGSDLGELNNELFQFLKALP